MLADELAEPVAHPRAIAVVAASVYRLSRDLLDFGFRFASSWRRSGQRSDFFNRADANAVSLPQCAVDGSSFSDAHFGAVYEWRYIGWIGIPVADKSDRG